MIRNLLNDHETIIKQIRKDIDLTAKINDMGTNNFLCDLIEKHEKTAWMLRAHLGK
jgi:starvation-inducible DNA-binding protein